MFRKAIILLALTTFVSGKVVSWNNSNFAENDLEVVSCSDGSHCPNGNTCCHRKDGSYTCCPLTNGVCCIGGNTCCPSNTRCDSEGGHCLSENETFPQNGTVAVSTFMKAIQHKVNQEIVGREFQGSKGINNFGKNDLEVEYCTDGSYCPSGNTCCLRRDGEFGCCPRLNGVCCIITYYDTSNGKGYVSRVYILTVIFSKPHIQPYQCIVKIPTADCLMEGCDDLEQSKESKDNDLSFVADAHNNEVLFYNTYTNIQGLHIPKCYGTKECIVGKQDGVLIMELFGSNYSHVEFFRCLSLSQAYMILDQINHLQSHFLSLPNEEWKDSYKFVINIQQYTDFLPLFKSNWDTIKSYLTPDLTDHLEDNVSALGSNYYELANYIVHIFPRERGNQVGICHGDMHCNNILFKNDSFGNPCDEPIILDWQIMYSGSIAADVARFLLFTTSPDTRLEIELNYLPTYYETLKARILKKEGKFEMTWEMFVKNYEISFIDQALQLLYMLNFVFRTDDIPKQCEMWKARKFLIGTRIVFALNQAVKYVKKHNPDWLINKNV
uniref:CHK domain-containing protein n=1 Tax=Rhabditophanes sp. KR3021 TaxID=114890 RepID=A0AC35TKQ0_9BILA